MDNDRPRQALSRRSFLFAALGVTGAGLLAACGQAAQPTPTPAAKPAAPATTAPAPAAAASPAAKPAASPAAVASPSAVSTSRTDAPPVPNNIVTAAKSFSGSKVVYYGDGVGPAGEMEKAAVDRFTKDTGINVQFTQRPQDATEALALFQRFFQGQSSDIDCMSVDVIWPGILAPHLADLTQKAADDIKLHYAGIIQNNTVSGKVVALPYFSDFGMLYYRTDLLQKYGYSKPPETWDELQEQATKIVAGEKASNPNFAGFVFQGKAYEGLTCNALEWLASSGGGTIVDASGKVTVNNPQAVAILNKVKGWIGNVVPQGVTSYQEEDARTAFGGGNAAFERNWPYAYSVTNQADSPTKGKFDVAPLPAQSGGKHSGTIGGWGMAVSKYSKNQDAAIQFIRYMTSPEFQTWHAVAGSFVPTIQTVADNPQVIAVQPYLKTMSNVDRVGRPSAVFGEQYNQASTAFFQGVAQVMQGQDAAQVLPDVQQKLQRLLS